MRLRLEELPHSYYLYELDWYDARSVLVRTMDRSQTAVDMGLCSVVTGSCRLLLTETDPAGGWVCDTGCRMYPLPELGVFVHTMIRGDTNHL